MSFSTLVLANLIFLGLLVGLYTWYSVRSRQPKPPPRPGEFTRPGRPPQLLAADAAPLDEEGKAPRALEVRVQVLAKSPGIYSLAVTLPDFEAAAAPEVQLLPEAVGELVCILKPALRQEDVTPDMEKVDRVATFRVIKHPLGPVTPPEKVPVGPLPLSQWNLEKGSST